MSDKATPLVLDALSRAMAAPAGLPLFGSKKSAGLFSSTAPAREAAQLCRESGYFHVVRKEIRGKSLQEICTISDMGIAYLLEQISPKQVLQDLVKAVETRGQQVGEIIEAARNCQETFTALQERIEKVLNQVQPRTVTEIKIHRQECVPPSLNGSHAEGSPSAQPHWKQDAVVFLSQWQTNRGQEDCPLPELYSRLKQSHPELTIGQYHDGLRQLHGEAKIYLHPWTGPLHEIREPALALLVGHAVVYYASAKNL